MWQNNREQIIILNPPFQQIFKHILLSFKIPLTHLLGPVPLRNMFQHIRTSFNSASTHILSYVSTRVMLKFKLQSFSSFFPHLFRQKLCHTFPVSYINEEENSVSTPFLQRLFHIYLGRYTCQPYISITTVLFQ